MSEFVKVFTGEDMKPDKLQGLTLVDFWATWCGPCRMVAPIVEELAAETPDVTFAKIDVDKNPDVAIGLRIASIPTLMLFKDGQLVDRIIGAHPKQDIKQMIDAHR